VPLFLRAQTVVLDLEARRIFCFVIILVIWKSRYVYLIFGERVSIIW
jgi:hypothetical protein